MPTFRPAVFIGLGTQGFRVLDALRVLIYEQIGHAGLPCVRFLSFQTHDEFEEQPKLPNEAFANDWEKIHLVRLTVDEKAIAAYRNLLKLPTDDAIRDAAGDPQEVNRLKEWFDWAHFRDATMNQIYGGAEKQRMLGRFALWYNFRQVNAVLAGAKDQVSKCAGDMEQLCSRLGSNYHYNPDPRALWFVSGSLVGGTCSGTFIDIGHFIRQGLQVDLQYVYGLFIVPNPDSIDLMDRTAAANAWVALAELGAEYEQGSEYRWEPRDSNPISASGQGPFRTVFLAEPEPAEVSGTTTEALALAFGPPLMRLCNVLALEMFANVWSSEFFSEKVSYAGNLAKGGKLPMATFGASVTWYPARRISMLVSLQLIEKEIDRLVASKAIDCDPAERAFDILDEMVTAAKQKIRDSEQMKNLRSMLASAGFDQYYQMKAAKTGAAGKPAAQAELDGGSSRAIRLIASLKQDVVTDLRVEFSERVERWRKAILQKAFQRESKGEGLSWQPASLEEAQQVLQQIVLGEDASGPAIDMFLQKRHANHPKGVDAGFAPPDLSEMAQHLRSVSNNRWLAVAGAAHKARRYYREAAAQCAQKAAKDKLEKYVSWFALDWVTSAMFEDMNEIRVEVRRLNHITEKLREYRIQAKDLRLSLRGMLSGTGENVKVMTRQSDVATDEAIEAEVKRAFPVESDHNVRGRLARFFYDRKGLDRYQINFDSFWDGLIQEKENEARLFLIWLRAFSDVVLQEKVDMDEVLTTERTQGSPHIRDGVEAGLEKVLLSLNDKRAVFYRMQELGAGPFQRSLVPANMRDLVSVATKERTHVRMNTADGLESIAFFYNLLAPISLYDMRVAYDASRKPNFAQKKFMDLIESAGQDKSLGEHGLHFLFRDRRGLVKPPSTRDLQAVEYAVRMLSSPSQGLDQRYMPWPQETRPVFKIESEGVIMARSQAVKSAVMSYQFGKDDRVTIQVSKQFLWGIQKAQYKYNPKHGVQETMFHIIEDDFWMRAREFLVRWNDMRQRIAASGSEYPAFHEIVRQTAATLGREDLRQHHEIYLDRLEQFARSIGVVESECWLGEREWLARWFREFFSQGIDITGEVQDVPDADWTPGGTGGPSAARVTVEDDLDSFAGGPRKPSADTLQEQAESQNRTSGTAPGFWSQKKEEEDHSAMFNDIPETEPGAFEDIEPTQEA